jgi:hypothetical protein
MRCSASGMRSATYSQSHDPHPHSDSLANSFSGRVARRNQLPQDSRGRATARACLGTRQCSRSLSRAACRGPRVQQDGPWLGHTGNDAGADAGGVQEAVPWNGGALSAAGGRGVTHRPLVFTSDVSMCSCSAADIIDNSPQRGSTRTERYRSGRNGGASKASCPLRGTWVRIPPSPPLISQTK